MKIQTLIIGLFLIGAVSAAIYSGETVAFDLGFEIVNCSIINSTYDLEGLDLSWNNTNLIISTSPYYKPDILTISCQVIKYKEVVEEHYSVGSSSGGGGGYLCKYNKTFDWGCSEWGECNGTQIRKCKEKNNCGNTYGKPAEIQNCIVPLNQTQIDIVYVEEPEVKWYVRFWKWLKNLFS